MNNPLVSIVVPSYNHSRYLRESIESVLSQTYKNVELIVLDDGSTDDTPRVLESYGTRFHWERQKNMGQAATLNKGWAMARGEVLAYLSADDRLEPNAAERAIECLANSKGAILAYCNFDLIGPDSRTIRKVIAPDYSYFDMVTKIVCAPGAGAFFLRSAYEKTGGWDPQFRRTPDYEFWLRLGLYGRFVRIDETLAAFRAHGGSQSFYLTSVVDAEEILRVMEKFYSLPGLPPDVATAKDDTFGAAHAMVAQLHLHAGRYSLGLSELRESVRRSAKILFSSRFYRLILNGLFNRYIHRILWRRSSTSAG